MPPVVARLEEGSSCPVCQVTIDGFGNHQVSCGSNGDSIHCHNSLRDALFSAAQSAALAPRREVPDFDTWSQLLPGSFVPPLLEAWQTSSSGCDGDLATSDTYYSRCSYSCITQGDVLGVGEERKLLISVLKCYSAGVSLVPLVVETLGGWNCDTVEAIKAIGHLQG